MHDSESENRNQATKIFKHAVKTSNSGIHRSINITPKGTGWVQCINSPVGLMCKPDKVRESIYLFKQSYDIFPDIVALNQIALSFEILGEFDSAHDYFSRMLEQALRENNSIYIQAANSGLMRV